MANRLFAESTEDWRASPNTARELVLTPTTNFTMTTTMLASRIPPRTRRTPDDFCRESAPLGMVQVGQRRAECQRYEKVSNLHKPEYRPLEIPGLRNGDDLGMVHSLAQNSIQHNPTATVAGGFGQHGQELGQAHVEGAGSGQ